MPPEPRCVLFGTDIRRMGTKSRKTSYPSVFRDAITIKYI